MTDVLIDLTEKRRYNINRCYYCDRKKFPQGRPILPSDKLARRTDKGDFMCGVCNLELKQRIVDGMQRRRRI